MSKSNGFQKKPIIFVHMQQLGHMSIYFILTTESKFHKSEILFQGHLKVEWSKVAPI